MGNTDKAFWQMARGVVIFAVAMVVLGWLIGHFL